MVNQTNLLTEIQCFGIGKIALGIRVAECAQQECGIHLCRALAGRVIGSRTHAVGKAVIVQVLHIRLFPALKIGKRRGVGQLFRLSLLAQQTDQHCRSLGTGGCLVKLVTLIRALEQSHVLQAVRTVCEVRRTGCCRNTGSNQHGCQCDSHLFHIVFLLLIETANSLSLI